MKVVGGDEMGRLERQAFTKYGPAQAEAFMEAAGQQVAQLALALIGVRRSTSIRPLDTLTGGVVLLCGKGNNAGDAYVCGRLLLESGLDVTAIPVAGLAALSPLCDLNYQRFIKGGGKVLQDAAAWAEALSADGCLIIDGLLGTGFAGSLPPAYTAVIEQVNATNATVIAIDVPSGVHASRGVERDPQGRLPTVLRASYTVTLGLPKLGLFMGEAWDYVGSLSCAEFGLQAEFIEAARAEAELLTTAAVRAFLPPLRPLRHKYEAGTVLALAGSRGMMGAAFLTCSAALRSGCGMVFLSAAASLADEWQRAPYELVGLPYSDAFLLDETSPATGTVKERHAWLARAARANACVLGPGLGRQAAVGALLRTLGPDLRVPHVLDADALNHYAEQPWPFHAAVIMTPHLGELERLLGARERLHLNAELIATCQKYAEERRVTLVVKGAVTLIVHPGCPVQMATFGNPGMATAGSGDVLSGILAALLAQGLAPAKAAALGVTLHGLAGKHAAADKTPYGLIASDLIAYLPAAFKELMTPVGRGD